jgi:hypothetical protein
MPEDILHARSEQSLLQVEGVSTEMNFLSPQRGILKQKYFSCFVCFFIKKELLVCHIIFQI